LIEIVSLKTSSAALMSCLVKEYCLHKNGDFTNLLGLIARTGLSIRILAGSPMILLFDLGGYFVTAYILRIAIHTPETSFSMVWGDEKPAACFVAPNPW
jgi:hypothetical protein